MRLPVIIVLVLAGVVGGAVLAGAAGVGGGAGPDKHPPVQREDQQWHRPGDDPGPGHQPPRGGH